MRITINQPGKVSAAFALMVMASAVQGLGGESASSPRPGATTNQVVVTNVIVVTNHVVVTNLVPGANGPAAGRTNSALPDLESGSRRMTASIGFSSNPASG